MTSSRILPSLNASPRDFLMSDIPLEVALPAEAIAQSDNIDTIGRHPLAFDPESFWPFRA